MGLNLCLEHIDNPLEFRPKSCTLWDESKHELDRDFIQDFRSSILTTNFHEAYHGDGYNCHYESSCYEYWRPDDISREAYLKTLSWVINNFPYCETRYFIFIRLVYSIHDVWIYESV